MSGADRVAEASARIAGRDLTTAAGIAAAGAELAAMRAGLGRAAWVAWVRDGLGMSEDTAERLVRVHRLARERPAVLGLGRDPSALYVLARPSTPAAVVDAALARAAAGERVTHALVRRLLAGAKEGRPTPPEAPVREPSPPPDGGRSPPAVLERPTVPPPALAERDGGEPHPRHRPTEVVRRPLAPWVASTDWSPW